MERTFGTSVTNRDNGIRSSKRFSLWSVRVRWSAIGASVAVGLGGGALLTVQAAPDTGSSTFVAVAPIRILDTRSEGKIGSLDGTADPRSLQVAGTIQTVDTGLQMVVPIGATAAMFNVTAVDTEALPEGGFVTVYPCGVRPTASNLNFQTGQTIPNSVTTPLSTSGYVCLYVYGKAHLLVDLVGYFEKSGIVSQGPAGPQGLTGATGLQGPAGPQGLTGEGVFRSILGLGVSQQLQPRQVATATPNSAQYQRVLTLGSGVDLVAVDLACFRTLSDGDWNHWIRTTSPAGTFVYGQLTMDFNGSARSDGIHGTGGNNQIPKIGSYNTGIYGVQQESVYSVEFFGGEELVKVSLLVFYADSGASCGYRGFYQST